MTTSVLVHVALSLVGILTGFVVVYGMLTAKRLRLWTELFLWTTVLTSVTGFFLPAEKFLPGHAFGILSLILLAIAQAALHFRHLEGGWRKAFVITAMIALYLNCFVLVVQAFQKVPALHEMAPTQEEPPFAIAQGLLLVLFVIVGVRSVKRFRV